MKKRFFAALLAGTMLFSLPGCAAGAATLAGDEPELPTQRDYSVEIDQDFSEALLQFTADSAEQVLLDEKNVCYSPVSLYYALAMAGTGAAGQTQEEIYAALGAEDTESLSADLETLYRALYDDDKHCKVYLANSIWMRDGMTFWESFTDNAAENFYAECYNMDFDSANTGKVISNWISDQTKGLLKPEVQLEPESIAVLLNTVYFKANWIDEFQKSNTYADEFLRADGTMIQCDFMHASRTGNAVGVDGYTKASLSFEGSWRMFFILPDEGKDIDSLLAEYGLSTLLDDSAAEYRVVEWSVPKFEAESELDLIPVLQTLGVETAFSDTAADFSGMCDTQALPGGVAYISAVTQGTKFMIDEEGAEAAAYTELGMNCGSAAPPDETITMDLDRPFIYGLQDGDGVVLFLGRCDDPTK